MNLRTFLKLGRVSNLPTIFSNVLLGAIFAGFRLTPEHADLILPALLLILAMSSLYTGGMFQNDYMDREHDRKTGKARPIVLGEVGELQVKKWTFFLLGTGTLLPIPGIWLVEHTGLGPVYAFASLVALLFFIIFYNYRHKGRVASAALMGLSRAFVYLVSFYFLGGLFEKSLFFYITISFVFVTALTIFARSEEPGGGDSNLFLTIPLILAGFIPVLFQINFIQELFLPFTLILWIFYLIYQLKKLGRSRIGKTITGLIAGISLLDGSMAVHWTGGSIPTLVVFLTIFLFTLGWQRRIAGT